MTWQDISTSAGPRYFILVAEDGRELLRINLKTGEVTGEIEDASEAGRVFIEYLRKQFPSLPLPSPPEEARTPAATVTDFEYDTGRPIPPAPPQKGPAT